MVRNQISQLELRVGGESRGMLSTPFSPHGRESMGELSLVYSIRPSAEELLSRHIFLRLHGARAPFEIFAGADKVGEHSAEREVCTFDIRPYLNQGENLIELRFSEGSEVGFTSAEIIRTDGAIIDRITVKQHHDGGTVTLTIKTELLGSPEGLRSVATLVSGAGQIYYCGLSGGRGTLTLKDALYWWPRGLGIQNLYKLTVNLYGESEIEDTYEMRVGLRAITTSTSSDGILLEANGAPYLPMGAVYSYEAGKDTLTARKMCEAVVASAAKATFNTLLVRLGTPPLPEYFYEMCDAHGIAVIHEIASIDEKTRELLIRSTEHSSIALLDLIGAADETESITEQVRSINPAIDIALFDMQPTYPTFPTMPSEKTLVERFGSIDKNILSEEVESAVGKELVPMLCSTALTLPYAKSLSDFSYNSRLFGAEKIGAELAHARITRARRAIFSSIGDTEFISPSSLDSMARWKALEYYCARLFTQTLLYAEREGANVSFFISNERRLAFTGEIEYRILDNKNRLIYKMAEPCRVNESSSERLFVRDLTEQVSGHEREYYLEYLLREGSSVISRGVMLFVEPKRFAFENPKISAEIVGDDRRFSITLSADSFAKCVELDFTDTDALFADNCFDMTTGAPLKISFTTLGKSVSAQHLTETLRIKSLYDII